MGRGKSLFIEMKYKFDYTTRFKKAYRKLSPKDRDDVDCVIQKLLHSEILEQKYRDHQLTGSLKGYRDCHVHPDLVLIYKKEDEILVLTAVEVGSHSRLFKM